MASERASVLAHRFAVPILVLAGIAVYAAKFSAVSLIPRDTELHFQIVYLSPARAAAWALLALFLVWRAGERLEGRRLALFMATGALGEVVGVVPSGYPRMEEKWAYAVVYASYWVVAARFLASFPWPLSAGNVEPLTASTRAGVRAWANRSTARAVHFILRGWGGKLAFLAAVLVATYLQVGPAEETHWFSYRTWSVEPPLLHGIVVAVTLTLLVTTSGFAWTGFRLADRERRGAALWIVLAALVNVLSALVTGGLIGLGDLLRSPTTQFLGEASHWVYMTVVPFLTLACFAASIFSSGAFDARPLIDKTTVYGTVVILSTVVFALLEEIMQSQLVLRVGLPEGAGTWIGAAGVALVFGPVRSKTERVMKRLAGHGREDPE